MNDDDVVFVECCMLNFVVGLWKCERLVKCDVLVVDVAVVIIVD